MKRKSGFKIKKSDVADLVAETRQCLLDGGWVKGSYGPEDVCKKGVGHCLVGAVDYAVYARTPKKLRETYLPRAKRLTELRRRALLAILNGLREHPRTANTLDGGPQWVQSFEAHNPDKQIIYVNDVGITRAADVFEVLDLAEAALRG